MYHEYDQRGTSSRLRHFANTPNFYATIVQFGGVFYESSDR